MKNNLFSLAVVDERGRFKGFVHIVNSSEKDAKIALTRRAKSFGIPFGNVFSVAKGPFIVHGRPSYNELRDRSRW
jgi:hypothetical protein